MFRGAKYPKVRASRVLFTRAPGASCSKLLTHVADASNGMSRPRPCLKLAQKQEENQNSNLSTDFNQILFNFHNLQKFNHVSERFELSYDF